MLLLEKLGLSEEQLKGCLTGEIEKLVNQERMLKDIVDKLAKQSNELYEKRSENALKAEALQIQVQETEKKVNLRFAEINKKEQELKDKEQTLSIREEKLRNDKESFSKERAIYGNLVKDQEATKEDNRIETAKLAEAKARLNEDYDLLDEKRIKIEKDIEALEKAKSEFKEKEKTTSARESQLRKGEENVEIERKKLDDKLAADLKKVESESQKVKKDREAFDAEALAEREAIKRRELETVRREKEVKNLELDIKSRLEALEIKEGKPVELKEKKKK